MSATRPTTSLLITLALSAPPAALAQYAAAPAGAGTSGTRPLTISPRISAGASATDNVGLAATNPRSETIFEVAPGLRMQANGRTLTGYLDYERREFHYAKDSSPRRGVNQLNAFGSLEAIENTLSVDLAGAITEETVSAFGVQGPGGATVNANRAESRVLSVSPVLSGTVGGYLDYSARFAATAARSDSSTPLGDSDSRDGSMRVGGGTPVVPLSWAITATTQRVRFSGGGESEADSASGRLYWQASPQFQLWASGGRESNNYLSIDRESETTRGAGFEWVPGPRTRLQAGRERRFFGDSDNVSISYRNGNTALRFDHSRGVSSPADDLTTSAGIGSIYDLVDAQFASRFPDPLDRAAAVDEFLSARGIAPDTQVTAGFLSARVFVQRASTLSLLLTGRRNTIVLSAGQTVSESLGSGLRGDDFDNFQRISQSGVSASWTLNLSPTSSVSLGGLRQRTTGEGAATQRTTLKSIQAGVLTQLGPRTALSFSLQRNDTDDATLSYVENTATLLLTYRH